MDGLKRKWNEFKGLELLLLFAFGPLKVGVCGDDKFLKKVQKILEREQSNITEIKKEIPEKLKTAWPNLTRIAEKNNTTPFSTKTVLEYIFQDHNKFASSLCRVKGGIVKKIDSKNKIIEIETGGTVKFLKNENIKKGDYISFHREWLIKKITLTQFNELRK